MVDQRLAYCGLGVTDVDAWVRFAVEALGLSLAESSGVRRLRMDDQAWRFAVHEAPDNDILYAGFELAGEDELTTLRRRLDAAGLAWSDLDAAECAERSVGGGLWLRDPDGLRLEFVRDHARASAPFRSDLTAGFLTGDEGLGHVVLSIGDLDRGVGFYEALGLKLSDFITAPIGPQMMLKIAFMHCNPRHHSLAIAQLPGGKRLNHIMVELNEVDDVIRGYQRCVALGYRTGGIGRHPNDLMLSFYVATPAGFDIEYGWGGRHIEGEWEVGQYDRISLWGHERTA
ncbi:MAG TPA: VOC family protein [Phenylobacterium sp.]|nr:VOC family protein [Phenylobacterium sp.]